MCKCYKYNSPGIQSKKIILYEFPNYNLCKRKLIVVVRHYICKLNCRAWLQNEKVLGIPFCPIKIGHLILKMVKHVCNVNMH